jgi:hypothetical protein
LEEHWEEDHHGDVPEVDLEGDLEGEKAFAFLVVVGMCQKMVETQVGVQIEVASYLARVLVVLLQAL